MMWHSLVCRAPNVKSFKIQSCPERFDLYGDYIAQEGNARTLLSTRANNKYVSTHTVRSQRQR